jgi:hypothetical protein
MHPLPRSCLSERSQRSAMTDGPLRRLQELADVLRESWCLFAGDEGDESGGLPVRAQSTQRYDGRPRFADCRSSRMYCLKLGACSRATKEVNLVGCLSERSQCQCGKQAAVIAAGNREAGH